MTIGEIVSRLRDTIKDQFGDSRYSNRYLYNLFVTSANYLIKQDVERSRFTNQSSFWQTLCIEMEPVSSIICNCSCIPSNVTVFRSKIKFPKMLEVSFGVVYRDITTPDFSKSFTLVSPFQYETKSKVKYNRTKYVFLHDGYLYSPKDTFPTILFTGIFEGDISAFQCGQARQEKKVCGSKLRQPISVPDYIVEPALQMALKTLFASKQIRTDEADNSNSEQTQGTP